MGKVDFTPAQKLIITEFEKNSALKKQFYFTGGTALSIFYLQHRLSDDLDFFTGQEFSVQEITQLMADWSRKHNFRLTVNQVEKTLSFMVDFRSQEKVKIDFSHYPCKKLKKEKTVGGLRIDSLLDIAVNKLLTINQRTNVKDFVDLYFLKDKFNLWQLREGVMAKFNLEIDPVLLAADLMKVEQFDFLPKMVRSLEISQLQDYFKKRAKRLAGSLVI